MKKILIVTFIMCISISLVACNKESKSIDNKSANNQNIITVEEAKDIAISHANLASDQVSILKEEYTSDNGIPKYDIEFFHKNKEYDYVINATTGEIIEYDNELEDFITEQQENTTNNKISVDEAKEIALKHSNLIMDQVKFIKEEYSNDNGIDKYEIDFSYNNTEYKYEINAKNGEILEFEKDK